MKFKKLIPALCMLLVAAVLMGTSTFAWFSMNDQVTATGMQVVVKSDNTYLLIGTGDNDTADEIQAANPNTTVALTVSDAQAKVYPSKPVENNTEAGYLTTSGKKVGDEAITTAGVIVNSAATAPVVTNWFTATAASVDAATMAEGSARQLVSFDGYVIKRTAYLTVADGSNHAHNLTVTPTFTQKASGDDLPACKMVIVTSDGGFAILSSANNGTAVDIKGSNTELTDSSVITVDMYIYVDGAQEKIYTNHAASLTGATINLSFKVDAVPAA